MAEQLKHVAELVDEGGVQDNTVVFEHLWGLLGEVREKVSKRLATEPDPSAADLRSWDAPSGQKVRIEVSSGPEVDWMVHSWIGQPEMGFSNMHLTVWLGPDTRCPTSASPGERSPTSGSTAT